MEDIVTSKDIFRPVMVFLRLCGCHPKEACYVTRFLSYLGTALNIFWAIFILIKLVNERNGIAEAANSCVNFLITTHIIVKSIRMQLNKETLSGILDIMYEKFWTTDEIPDQSANINEFNKTILRLMKLYIGIMSSSGVMIAITPSLLPIKQLPFEMWFFGLEETLHKSPYYDVIYFLQCMTLLINFVFVLASDCMFMATVGVANVQFDILKHKFMLVCRTEDEKEAMRRMREAVGYHNTILHFLKEVESYFSIMVLKQFADSITLTGVYIYLIQQDFQLSYLFSLMTNISQAFLFSLYGQIIQDQSCSIASGAFESGWESIGSLDVRRGIRMIIQRSQRKIKMTAGGLMDLSFENYLRVLKAAFSFLAFLRSTNKYE